MYKQILQNVWDHPAYSLAVSDDHKLLAVSSARQVRILSLPERNVIARLAVRDPGFLTFLEGRHALVIANTAGTVFFWEAGALQNLGKWPEHLWSEGPIFCCGKDAIALAYCEIGTDLRRPRGIAVLEISTGQYRDIYPYPEKETRILGYRNGKLHLLSISPPNDYAFGRNRMRPIALTAIDHFGNVRHQACLGREARILANSAMLDENCFAACLQSRAARFLNRFQATAYDLCLFDGDGHIINSIPLPKGCGEWDCPVAASSEMIAVAADHNAVFLFDRATLSLAGQITDLCPDGRADSLSSLLFLSERELLVGTWEKLFLYRIEPSSAPKVNGRIV